MSSVATRLSLPLSHTNSPAYPPPPPERPGPPTRTPQTFKHHTLSRRPPPRRGDHPLRQHDDSRCPARRSPREGTPPQRPTQQSPNQPRDVCLRVRVCMRARGVSLASPSCPLCYPSKRALDERTGTEGITRRWGSRYHARTAIQRPERAAVSRRDRAHPLEAGRTR